MVQQPNPWLLFIGGIAMLNVSMMAWGLPAPLGVRYGATILCVVLGLTAMGLGLARYFKNDRSPPPGRPRGSRRDGAPGRGGSRRPGASAPRRGREGSAVSGA